MKECTVPFTAHNVAMPSPEKEEVGSMCMIYIYMMLHIWWLEICWLHGSYSGYNVMHL